MPQADPFHKSPDDFDPDQTLFFQRRKQNVSLLPLIVGCVLLLGSGALIVWAFSGADRHPAAAKETPAISQSKESPGLTTEQARLQNAPRAELVTPGTLAIPAPAVTFDASKPVRAALPVGTPPVAQPVTGDPDDDAPPSTPDPSAPLNLNAQDPANAQVRTDVLRRIDLMPGITPANKDKLYASVDHARSMGRVLTIPFVKGATTVSPADVDKLKAQIASPALRATVDDPSAVFVILGYADPKGSDKVNTDLSLSRARSVMDALRDHCGVGNVMHTVAMGGSTLFSAKEVEKNRVVEVWAVLP